MLKQLKEIQLLKKEMEKDSKRKPKKKKIGRAIKSIEYIKNKDKIGAEKWTDQRKKNIGNFPSPSRIVLLGPCGKGKTTLIKNLIMHQRPKFDEVFLVHEDAEFTKEYQDMDLTDQFDEIPNLEFWETDGRKIKRAIIIDDLELTSAHKERKKNLAILFRYASSHKFLTVYFSHQSFFDIPNLIKKMSNIYIIWEPRARNELSMIENRIGLPKESLKKLFKTVAINHRDSICVDMTENSPCKLRLNIWKKIKINESESDEDEDVCSDEHTDDSDEENDN